MSCKHLKSKVVYPAEDVDDSEVRECIRCGEKFVRMPMLEGKPITGTGKKYGKYPPLSKRPYFRSRRKWHS